MESAIVASDKGSTTLVVRDTDTKVVYYGYSKSDVSFHNARNCKGRNALAPHLPRVRKHERIIHHHINTYDDWYRLIKATGKFVGSDNKSANYHLEMGYDNLYNITSKKLTMTQTNLQFAGTLSAGHEFSYNYSTDNPMQLASVETKQYNVDGSITDVDEALAKNIHTQDYEFDDNGNMVSVSVAKNEEGNPEGEQEATEDKDVLKSFLWDEENRLLAVNNNGSVSCYFYDAAGERTVKLTSESEMVHVNGKKVGGNANICKFTAYVSPYFVVSNGGAYTKHIYAASQRIASKLGNEDGFGADPRRVEQAGGKKISDFQKDNVGERFKALGYEYSAPEKEKVEKDSTMDSEEPENLVFFYHPDHLGSTSYVTDADGNIAQHVEYIPYGEVFVEERNSQFSTNFLFNAKELDNETGLYYYGARYLDPTGAMWLSVDPMWEKYAGMSPYNYCMGNPVKMVDPDGEELLPFFSFNYVKETPQNKNWFKMYGKRHNQQVQINAKIWDYVLNMEDMDNVIFFSAHGEPQGFYDHGDKKHEGGESFIEFLQLNSSSYEKLSKNKSLVIVLFSCETGKGENSLGQQVSKISESLVFAPSELIYIDPDGRHQVENRGKDGHIHGYWNVFYKGELIDQLNGADVDGKKAIQIDKFLQGKSGEAWIKWYTEEWKWIKKMHEKQNEN